MKNKVGFEYLNKHKETIFEIFLKYTDEKKKSSAVLGKILKRLLNEEGMTFLDIGAGNGEYLRMSLIQIKSLKRTEITLLEPSSDLVKRLRLTTKKFPRNLTIKVVHSTFDDFTTNSQFDIILASHLPFTKDRLPMIFGKMLELLKSKSHLVVVLRRKDDIHEFRTMFKSKLMRKDYTSLIIDDAVESLNNLAKNIPLRISMFSSNSELRLPIADNIQDVISIIEFFLNKKWEEFPDDIRKAVLDYISRKKGILHQSDGFALVEKI